MNAISEARHKSAERVTTFPISHGVAQSLNEERLVTDKSSFRYT